MRAWRMTAVLMTAIAAAGCGGAGGGNDAGPTTPTGNTPGASGTTITLVSQSFNPTTLTVVAGTTVTWQWNDCGGGYGGNTGCVAHNVTFDDGSNIASSTRDSGTFSRLFATAGTFKYHCTIHGSAMSGQVVVK